MDEISLHEFRNNIWSSNRRGSRILTMRMGTRTKSLFDQQSYRIAAFHSSRSLELGRYWLLDPVGEPMRAHEHQTAFDDASRASERQECWRHLPRCCCRSKGQQPTRFSRSPRPAERPLPLRPAAGANVYSPAAAGPRFSRSDIAMAIPEADTREVTRIVRPPSDEFQLQRPATRSSGAPVEL